MANPDTAPVAVDSVAKADTVVVKEDTAVAKEVTEVVKADTAKVATNRVDTAVVAKVDTVATSNPLVVVSSHVHRVSCWDAAHFFSTIDAGFQGGYPSGGQSGYPPQGGYQGGAAGGYGQQQSYGGQ